MSLPVAAHTWGQPTESLTLIQGSFCTVRYHLPDKHLQGVLEYFHTLAASPVLFH